MTVVVALLRVLIAVVAGYGGYRFLALDHGRWDTFSLASALLLTAVSLWSATSLLVGRALPSPVIDLGAVVLAVGGGLVYQLKVDAKWWDPAIVAGLSAGDLVHMVAPGAALLVWLLCSPHQQASLGWLRWWVAPPAAFVALVLVRGQLRERSDYVYPFLDPEVLGWREWGANAALFIGVFAVLGAVLIVADRLLAERTVLTAGHYVVP